MRRKHKRSKVSTYPSNAPDPSSLGMHDMPVHTYKRGGRIRSYRKGGMVVPCYDAGTSYITGSGVTYQDPYRTGPSMENGSFSTQGNPGEGFNYGQAAGYASAGINAAANIATNVRNPYMSDSDKLANSAKGVADVAGNVIAPGWYGYAKTASNFGKSLLARDENGQAKGKLGQSADAFMTPLHEQTIDQVSHGKYGDVAINAATGGMYSNLKPLFMKNGGGVYDMGWVPYLKNGGSTSSIIDIQRNELQVDPKNMSIVSDYKHKDAHAVEGPEPKGNYVNATVGNVIIPADKRHKFMNGTRDSRQRLINSLPNTNGFARYGDSNIQDEGVQPPRENGFYNFTGEGTLSGPSMQDGRFSTQGNNPYFSSNNSVQDPASFFGNQGPGTMNGSQLFPQTQHTPTDWRGIGESVIPFAGDLAQLGNALASKSRYGSRLRNREYGNAINLMQNRRYDNRDEIRGINSGYNSAKAGIRDASGGSSGSYLANLANLSSSRYGQISQSYANKNNQDNQYLAQEAQVRMGLGSEDAGYQGQWEQDKLMAEAARRKSIFAPMQDIGQNYLMQQAYSRAYPRYK